MDKWTKEDNLEKVKVTIEIPKDIVAFIVQYLVIDADKITIGNTTYDSADVEKLIEDSKKVGE